MTLTPIGQVGKLRLGENQSPASVQRALGAKKGATQGPGAPRKPLRASGGEAAHKARRCHHQREKQHLPVPPERKTLAPRGREHAQVQWGPGWLGRWGCQAKEPRPWSAWGRPAGVTAAAGRGTGFQVPRGRQQATVHPHEDWTHAGLRGRLGPASCLQGRTAPAVEGCRLCLHAWDGNTGCALGPVTCHPAVPPQLSRGGVSRPTRPVKTLRLSHWFT